MDRIYDLKKKLTPEVALTLPWGTWHNIHVHNIHEILRVGLKNNKVTGA